MSLSAHPQHPLYQYFAQLVHDAIHDRMRLNTESEVESYLTSLLVSFLHTDTIASIRNREGRRLWSVADMVAEGDIRLHADSFDREREVHKHIGDFLLFWSGIYPEFLKHLKVVYGHDLICDYTKQGKESYFLVSTFNHAPYQEEAPTFRTLSDGFEEFVYGLGIVRRQMATSPFPG